MEHEMRLLLLLLIVGFAIDVFTAWKNFNDFSLLLLAHIYSFVEFVVVMFIIVLWQDSKKMKRIFQAVGILFFMIWIYSKLTFEPFSGLYSFTASVSRIMLSLGAGYTLFIVFENRTQSLFSTQRFWILISFIVSFAGTLMPVAVQEILFAHSKQSLFIAWYVTWASTIIANILFTIGFLCPQKPI
jgi:hypothetical protein